MGYVSLITALFAGTIKGYCGKKTSGYTNEIKDAIFANIVRMFFCVIFGMLILKIEGESACTVSFEFLLISAISGISTAIFVVTWLISVRKSTYLLLDVFLMLGVIVTLVLSKVIFKENIKYIQWFGIGLLFIAVFLMCSYNNSIKIKITLSSFAILAICGIANGISDFAQKLFIEMVDGISVTVFNFYTYVFASLILILALFIVNRGKQLKCIYDLKRFQKMFGYILVMAICLFFNSYFKTLAAETLSAVLLYPLNQGGSLILSAVMSVICFGEKLTLKAVAGVVIAFAGLIIINLL